MLAVRDERERSGMVVVMVGEKREKGGKQRKKHKIKYKKRKNTYQYIGVWIVFGYLCSVIIIYTYISVLDLK